jgi:NADPH-dependent FMN reductase
MTSTGPGYDDLSALFFNCTLKPSPQLSHTQGLIDRSAAIMAAQNVRTETIRAADHDIATGVWPDMTEHGAVADAWPRLYQKVLAADILVIAGPIWLGDNSSVTKRVIERLYACSHLLNDALLPRPRFRRPGQRLHQPQHHVHDVEPAAPGPDAQGRRRHPRPRQPAFRLGRRLPLRLRQPRLPLTRPPGNRQAPEPGRITSGPGPGFRKPRL